MLYLCLNTGCDALEQPPGPRSTCIACHLPLTPSDPDNSSSYELSFSALRNLPRYGNLESSISTISASSGSAAGTGPSSLFEQMGPSHPSSEYGALETHQSPFQNSSPKSYGLLDRGSSSANFSNSEAARLRTIPPASSLNPDSSANSSGRAGLLNNPVFKYWNPSAVKSSKFKTRSCISCYRRGIPCNIAEGQEVCDFCSGKSLCCKEPIEMAIGFTPQYYVLQLMGKTGAEIFLLHSIIENNPLFDVHMTLMAENHTSSQFAQIEMLDMGIFQMDLRNLRDNTPHSNEAWEKLLDITYPNPEGETTDLNANALGSFRRLCRHFTAALALLGSPELCTFDVITSEYSAGPFIMLETIRQLYAIASSTFSRIFDAMKKYLDAPRKRSVFRREMFNLGFGLGLCHHAMSHFGKASMDRTDFPSGLAGLFDVPPCLLEQLKFLGGTFDSDGFQNSSQAISPKRFGLHIALNPVEGYSSHKTRRITFIKGFEQFLDSNLSSPHTSSAFSGNLTSGRKFPTSRESLVRQNLSEQTRNAGDGSLMGAGRTSTDGAESQVNPDQPTDPLEPETMERKVRSEVSQLQQKRDELEKQMKEQIAYYDKRITSLQLMLDIRFGRNAGVEHSELEGQEEQMLPFTTPVFTDANDNTLREGREASLSSEKIVGFSSSNVDNSLGLPYKVDHEYRPMMGIDMPLSTPRNLRHAEKHQTHNDQDPPLKKRKRVLGFWQTQQQAIGRFCDDADATMPDAMDIVPAPATAEQTTTSVSSFGKQIFQTFPVRLSFLTRKSQIDTKAAGHADFGSEIPSANIKSQRPVSWPRTEQWRKSIGVSVKTLRENFEKLALESKEPTAPRSLKQASLLK